MPHSTQIPREVPVMTLEGAVLFPKAMMPLYIYEPRYRAMLAEVLGGQRIFAVAALDESAEGGAAAETPCSIAGLGVVRACKKNANGSAQVLLQGLARVELESIVSEDPFRRARIREIKSVPGGLKTTVDSIQGRIQKLVYDRARLDTDFSEEVIKFLKHPQDPESMLDLAIYTLCGSSQIKQELLETRGVVPRFHRFVRYLRADIRNLKLERKLKGDLPDNNIGNN